MLAGFQQDTLIIRERITRPHRRNFTRTAAGISVRHKTGLLKTDIFTAIELQIGQPARHTICTGTVLLGNPGNRNLFTRTQVSTFLVRKPMTAPLPLERNFLPMPFTCIAFRCGLPGSADRSGLLKAYKPVAIVNLIGQLTGHLVIRAVFALQCNRNLFTRTQVSALLVCKPVAAPLPIKRNIRTVPTALIFLSLLFCLHRLTKLLSHLLTIDSHDLDIIQHHLTNFFQTDFRVSLSCGNIPHMRLHLFCQLQVTNMRTRQKPIRHLTGFRHRELTLGLFQKRRPGLLVSHIGIDTGTRCTSTHIMLLQLRHQPFHRRLLRLRRKTFKYKRFGLRTQTRLGQIVLVITCIVNGLPTQLFRNIDRTNELRIVRHMALLVLVLIIFGQCRQIVPSQQRVNIHAQLSILRPQFIQRIRHILTGPVRTVSTTRFHVGTPGCPVRQKARVHANNFGNPVNQRQQLIELLRRNDFIFCTRIRNHQILIHLLINRQDVFCLMLPGQPTGHRRQIQHFGRRRRLPRRTVFRHR